MFFHDDEVVASVQYDEQPVTKFYAVGDKKIPYTRLGLQVDIVVHQGKNFIKVYDRCEEQGIPVIILQRCVEL